MTDERKSSGGGGRAGDEGEAAGEAWDRALEGQLDFEASRVANKTAADVDASLEGKGVDPAAARARGEALVARLLAGKAPAPPRAGAPQPVRAIAAPSAERPRASRVVWIGAAVFAAAAALLLLLRSRAPESPSGGPALAARDDAATRLTARPAGKTPLELAAELRRQGLSFCGRAAWTQCLGELDAAARIDPDGDKEPSVVAARAAARKAIDDEARLQEQKK